jgi:hypothetical protein
MTFDNFTATFAFDREGVIMFLWAGRGGTTEKFLEKVHD